MAELNTMYEGVTNSPDTFLTSALASGGNILYIADDSVFGALPNLVVLGTGANAETILVINKRIDNGYNIQRAVEGVARDWPQATIAARNFTNKDYQTLIDNINLLNTEKLEKNSAVGDNTTTFTIATTRVNIVSGESLKVLFGKIAKWFADLKTVAWTGLLSDLTQTASYRTVTDTEKSTWDSKQNAMSAGTNVTISNNVISATDTKYTAGTNITINGNTINAADTKYDLATISADGLMPSTDKTKINNIEVSGIKVYASTDTIPTLPNGVVALIYEV